MELFILIGIVIVFALLSRHDYKQEAIDRDVLQSIDRNINEINQTLKGWRK